MLIKTRSFKIKTKDLKKTSVGTNNKFNLKRSENTLHFPLI